MTENSYLEKCIEVVAELRQLDLSSMTRGEYIGEGSSFRVYNLGQIGLDGSTHLGLKLSKPPRKGQSIMRLSQEIASIDKILEKVPNTIDRVPSFMGLIAVGDSDNDVAVVTEEVTKGLTLSIRPIPADWPEELAQGLGGEYGDYVDQETIAGSLAFDVDGEEKWLDFTPSPFGVRAITDPIYEDMDKVLERQKELTVTIPSDSPLASSLS